ncbi:hypothetical protein [Streptomyces sp. NPDC002250]|uniref:hypothetical protein n=1 Tax=Streptomyces sp. NPDC002250 TaxID=3364641 RepID=UPI003676F71B
MTTDPRKHPQAASVSARAFDAKAVTRSYDSFQHLYAAWYLAEDAAQRERDLRSEAFAFDLRHRGYVLSAITESVAFLEGTINEIYADSADGRGAYIDQLPVQFRSRVAEVWGVVGDRLPILDKYSVAISMADREGFDKGANPYQDASRLIALRNYVVHTKPREGVSGEPHRFEKSLRGRFPDNALTQNLTSPWFPDHAFGAGCAQWAWRSARAFVDEFSNRVGLLPLYKVAGNPLPA